MGIFDTKNVCIDIRVRENLTDPRFVEFMEKEKHWDFSEKEYMDFESSAGPAYTEISHRIITFITEYKDGILMPDRCGCYEPLRREFKKEEVPLYTGWLSYPGGGLMLKKRRKFDVYIKNRYFVAMWDGETGKSIPPAVPLPEYMGQISFSFSKQRKIDMVFLEELLRDYCGYLETDFGFIYDMEDDKILFDLFHPERAGTLCPRVW